MSRPRKASRFFSRKEKARILDAIRESEKMSSAEIRLHVDSHCECETMERAKELFQILHMHETENRNGVLIYLAVADRQVSIIGDSGIDDLTSEGYWDDELQQLLDYFKRNDFIAGIVKIVSSVGAKLATHFPVEEGDVNELSDEISFYDN